MAYQIDTRTHESPSSETAGPAALSGRKGPSPRTSQLSKRKRTKRACDRCHASRTRCDGDMPCQHCVDYELVCGYSRNAKSRGRARKENSQPASSDVSDSIGFTQLQGVPERGQHGSYINVEDFRRPNHAIETSNPVSNYQELSPSSSTLQPNSFDDQGSLPDIRFDQQISATADGSLSPGEEEHRNTQGLFGNESTPQNGAASATSGLLVNGNSSFGKWPAGGNYSPLVGNLVMPNAASRFSGGGHTQLPSTYPLSAQGGDISYADQVQRAPELFEAARQPDTSEDSTRALPPASTRLPSMVHQPGSEYPSFLRILNPDCRYPVLQPVLPYISTILPCEEACDLLDLYFKAPSTSLFECASPYVLTQIFRKKAFLREHAPRHTSPALLAAMLWVTAQTSDAPIFKTSHRVRSRICDELYAICISLLDPSLAGRGGWKPLFQTHLAAESLSMDETCNQKIASPTSSSPVSTLDNVITYALLGVVISGGETKGECMKFWTKAWTMAREIGLHREDSDNCPRDTNPLSRPSDQFITPGLMNHLAREEIKEERRRTWWLLFIADRHLALCYNSPLNILDSECTVNQPLDDETWQDLDLQMNTYHTLPRSRGPATKMTGTGLFEYFLPLMAVLGDIVDIHHLSNHPRFAGTIDMEAPIRRVEQSLEIYQASLKAFEQSILLRFSDMDQPLMASSPQTIFTATRKPQQWSAEQVRYKTVIAYSNHLLHVLYILLHGPWDPMTMLDSAEQRIVQSNRSFVKCAQHAISAASSVSEILKFDPELSFMPYLFGIYLMHGSFTLLIFADKIEIATSETVSHACETMIRAHEVCVTTLNTEYQRNFRKVLRSALYKMQGTMAIDLEQHQARRREFLLLYQWSRGGKGLAI